jgi:hypothetical protein
VCKTVLYSFPNAVNPSHAQLLTSIVDPPPQCGTSDQPSNSRLPHSPRGAWSIYQPHTPLALVLSKERQQTERNLQPYLNSAITTSQQQLLQRQKSPPTNYAASFLENNQPVPTKPNCAQRKPQVSPQGPEKNPPYPTPNQTGVLSSSTTNASGLRAQPQRAT